MSYHIYYHVSPAIFAQCWLRIERGSNILISSDGNDTDQCGSLAGSPTPTRKGRGGGGVGSQFDSRIDGKIKSTDCAAINAGRFTRHGATACYGHRQLFGGRGRIERSGHGLSDIHRDTAS